MVSNEVGRGTHQPAGPDQQGWQKKFHVMNSWGSFTLGTLCSALFACQPMLLFNDNARYSTKFHNQDYTVTIITYVWQGILETSRSHSDLSRQTHLPRIPLTFTIHHDSSEKPCGENGCQKKTGNLEKSCNWLRSFDTDSLTCGFCM